jgi:hypothetical protein
MTSSLPRGRLLTHFGRIDIDAAAEFDRAGLSMRRSPLARFLFIIPLVVMASAASAQQQGHDACARDVTRHCRAVMNGGDQAVLACLKQNRARLSKACAQVLIDHGQ